MRKRRKTAKAALLCLFCALLMAALPVTALAETETYEPIPEISVRVDKAYDSNYDPSTGLEVIAKGSFGGFFYEPGEAIILLTNQSGNAGKLSFYWESRGVYELFMPESDGEDSLGNFNKLLNAGESVKIAFKTDTNVDDNILIISDITFTEGAPEPEHN